MQCNDIQEMLSAYIDGVLDENEVSVVEDHIRICSFCSQELTALRETVKLLNSLGEVSPPAEFRSQLMQRMETVSTESGAERGRVGVLESARMRKWVRGINKYLVAAVLMIGLGIGTGLYKLGVTTGSQTFDLALNAKAKAPAAINTQLPGGSLSKKEIPGQEAPKIAENVSMAKSTVNTGTGETSSVKPKDQASAGSGSLSQQEQNARNAAPPGLGAIGSANKGIMDTDSTLKPAQKEAQETASELAQRTTQKPAQMKTTMADSPEGQTRTASKGAAEKPSAALAQNSLAEKKVSAVEPQVIQNASLVIEVGNFQVAAAKIPEMMWRADGFISNSTENLIQPATGNFTLKVPAQNLQGLLLKLEQLGKVTQRQTQGTVVANDLKNVDESAAYATIELEIKAEAKPSGVSTATAGWILPGALLAAGIGCAAYYFYLRWRKN